MVVTLWKQYRAEKTKLRAWQGVCGMEFRKAIRRVEMETNRENCRIGAVNLAIPFFLTTYSPLLTSYS
jgi:hypothetical protein